MKYCLLILLYGFFSCNLKSQDCLSFQKNFSSYNEAIQKIKSTSFRFSEKVNTAKSSWIKGASYYSCDSLVGFFILRTDKQEYVYKDVPIEVWVGFKDATSFGSYYNKEIKGRYSLPLN
jgi:hypothetical protein